jgi:hypothetical protein
MPIAHISSFDTIEHMFNDVMPPGKGWRPKSKANTGQLLTPKQLPVVESAKPTASAFKTPEEIARDEAIQNVIADKPEPPKASGKASRFSKLKISWPGLRLRKPGWPPTRKQQIIGGVLIIVLAFGIGVGWTLAHHKRTVVAVTPKKPAVKKVKPAPLPIYSNLTGLPVADKSVNERAVTGIMIENSLDARPQSGLDSAGVVFEAIAEGGITRFLTLFQDTAPDYLGPVRSVRPYYIEWGLGFDAAIAHVGGSPEALQDMKSWSVKDLDQFANGSYYHRITSRAAPHNVYTSIAQLNQIEANKGYGAASYTGFTRKDEKPYKAPAPAPAATTKSSTNKATKSTPPPDTRTPATGIDIGMSGPLYNVHYDYDSSANSYKRSEGGAAHMSLHQDGSQVQIAPKVVIALVTTYGIQSDGKHSDYAVTGSGTAYIFQDGTVTVGKWSKAADREPLKFTDDAGNPFALDRGQTWISAVAGTTQVTYK